MGKKEEERVEQSQEELDADDREASMDEESEDVSEEEDEDEEDEEEGSDEDENDRPRRKPKKKAFIPPPPRDLPQRTTRGQRLGTVAAVADEGADEEFWNQEFFAEEEQDERYETESEPEDVYDKDFNSSDDDDDEEDVDEEAEEQAKARDRKKTMRPPGYVAKKPPAHKPKPKPKQPKEEPVEGEEGEEGEGEPASKRRRSSSEVFIPPERTMGVRLSTRQKVQDAEQERMIQEALKPRRTYKATTHRALTQQEMLNEAARTEIENLKSLQMMVALEEATKKKANAKKAKYVGPMVRWKSHAIKVKATTAATATADGDAKEGEIQAETEEQREEVMEEQTTLEVRNMQTPEELLPHRALPPPPAPVCVVSGKPARYKDPKTGAPYADLEAYKELKRRSEAAVMAVQVQQQQFLAVTRGQQHMMAL